MFIEPSGEALKASADLGAPVVELHTGAWCDALAHRDKARADYEFGRLRVAAAQTAGLGLECHAGHGLDYNSARVIAGLPQIVELNIGHFLDRRGDFRRPRRDGGAHARGDGGGPGRAGRRAMIVGIGSDLCDIRRIEATLERFGERFVARCFTEIERRRSDAPRRPRRLLRQAVRRQGGLRQGARHGAEARRVLARHGGRQPAVRPADDAADRRRGRAPEGDPAARDRGVHPLDASPTSRRSHRPSSSSRRVRRRKRPGTAWQKPEGRFACVPLEAARRPRKSALNFAPSGPASSPMRALCPCRMRLCSS